ncbi:hypothetical protein CUT44_01740 [Streptomyces carminius]|uniref:Uncharacterized protein n=1 Tax=Streptomyces carminius TaxID=2665496 RepID=A0A2M8M1C6_9ACTN|nr:hypothetical protein [Streptomyces carminius]PJE97995.1 hypothetical protein CUT44_10000 [Streptomyces carminius]PJF01821.1 hypothetical protein CUT44_01740 [Streptomyces carminius]
MTDENEKNSTYRDEKDEGSSREGRTGEFQEAERRRERSRPFDYPYRERRANVRARRHISREEADADMPPGLSGGYGTTGGGQPAGPAQARPGRSVVEEDPAGTVDEDGAASGAHREDEERGR